MAEKQSIKRFIVRDPHGHIEQEDSFSVVGEVHVDIVPGYGEPYAESEYVNGVLTITIHNIEGNGITSITTDSQEGDEAVNTVTIKTNANPEGVTLEVRNGSRGNGIASFSETLSPDDGGINTHTITDTDGNEHVFHTRNGHKGDKGDQGDSAIWTGEGELWSGLKNTTGQSTTEPMSQKAVSDIVVPLEKQVNGGEYSYVEISPTIENDYIVSYTGEKRAASTSGAYAFAEIALAVGQSVKLDAYGETSIMPIGIKVATNTYSAANDVKRYAASKTREVYEYTAIDDCYISLCFRIGQSYPYHIYTKEAAEEGLVNRIAGKIDDAPANDKSYVRKNANWEEFPANGGIDLVSINIVEPDNWLNGSMLADGTIKDDRTYGFRTKNPIPVKGGESITLMQNAELPNGTRLYQYSDNSYNKASLTCESVSLYTNPIVKLEDDTKYIVLMLSVSGTITPQNYLEYAAKVGVAYSTIRMTFKTYSKSVIGEGISMLGVHRHIPRLKWIAMGDSITDGSYSTASSGPGGDDAGGATKRETCWAAKVAEINDYELTNVGLGGTGWLKKGSQGNRKNAREQVDDYDFGNYDIVTLAFGINDWKSTDEEAYGTLADEKTANTVVGAMKYCIEKILADNPYIRLIIITPMNCHSGTFETNYAIGREIHGHTLADMYDLMVSVCNYYTLPYIDMTYRGIINRCNVLEICGDGLPADDPTRDNVHPTLEGHKRMAYVISQEMKCNC